MSVVDPQTCTDAQLRRRMRRYVKLEPTFLAAMVDNERNYWIPQRDVPVPRADPVGDYPYRCPTLQAVIDGRAAATE